ncbi:sensor histidine kinase [Terribacillus saccharophilus]|uniref:sensor histidine kinase n=1 Tax=Terribacillus saccharophilus TaxID=361277 RepID=UPI003D2A6499
MTDKIYPRDQIGRYLVIDVTTIVFLIFIVFRTDATFGLWGKFLFLLLYVIAFYTGLWYRDWRLLAAVLLGLLVLTLFAVFGTIPILLFAFTFADLIGRSKSKTHIAIGMSAIAIMFFMVHWKVGDNLSRQDYMILLPVFIVLLLLPILIYIKEKAKGLQGRLDAAHTQIEKYIQQEERHRIARDLHDTLGQTLTMIKLKSELTSRLIDHNADEAKQEVKDISMMARKALHQVREAVSEMRYISLESELETSQALMEGINIELNIEKEGELPLLPSVGETMIALTIREAMTNIMKHSKANQCIVRLMAFDNAFSIQIIDNGIGLRDKGPGNGIQSMKERMEVVQGTAEVANGSSGGTSVTLILPIFQTDRGFTAL